MNTVHHNGTTPQPVSSYDWETDTHTHNTAAMDAAQIWRTAVAIAATDARQALPDSNGRIDKAIELVLTGAVELLDNGTARVTSQHNGDTAYRICNGTCDCPDFARAPAQWCKHRLGRAIAVRATQHAKELGLASPDEASGGKDEGGRRKAESNEEDEPDPAPAPGYLEIEPDHDPAATTAPAPAPPPPPAQIPSQFLVTINGKQFVTFHGLLCLAHQQGLLSLTEEVTHVTDAYVMAQARATFSDGRVFQGVGDSTPDNVGAKVKPHWRRLAGTRAMARALRNGLNVTLVALEELEG